MLEHISHPGYPTPDVCDDRGEAVAVGGGPGLPLGRCGQGMTTDSQVSPG
jgi:hypothetical protein